MCDFITLPFCSIGNTNAYLSWVHIKFKSKRDCFIYLRSDSLKWNLRGREKGVSLKYVRCKFLHLIVPVVRVIKLFWKKYWFPINSKFEKSLFICLNLHKNVKTLLFSCKTILQNDLLLLKWTIIAVSVEGKSGFSGGPPKIIL